MQKTTMSKFKNKYINLLAALILLVSPAVGIVSTASALGPLLATQEAEAMTPLPSGAAVFGDSTASGSKAVKILNTTATDIQMSGSVTLSDVATNITLRARATPCQNVWPNVIVSVDGQPVFSTSVNVNSPWTTFTSNTLSVAPGTHNILLDFNNPMGASGCTRILYFDALSYYAIDPALVPPPATSPSIYWGDIVLGSTYGYRGSPPTDMTAQNTFEANVGKAASLMQIGRSWGSNSAFSATEMDAIRNRGSIPILTWGSQVSGAGPNQSIYKSSNVTRGDYDAYITQFATDAKNWGHPFFLRFDWEANGNWYPWSDAANGNQKGDYVAMYRHVHDIFTQVGATNVTWIWCLNREPSFNDDVTSLYPGEDYVDWTGIDGYNKSIYYTLGWKSFDQIFRSVYDKLGTIAPSKPTMIVETGSVETGAPIGSSKAQWLSDALNIQLPINYTRVKGLSYYNVIDSGVGGTLQTSYPLESSTGSLNSFKNAIASPRYAANTFGNLPDYTKIQPLQ
jgi:hypothetical protein